MFFNRLFNRLFNRFFNTIENNEILIYNSETQQQLDLVLINLKTDFYMYSYLLMILSVFLLSSYVFFLRKTLQHNHNLFFKIKKDNDKLLSINNKFKTIFEKINEISKMEDRTAKRICLIKNLFLQNKIAG
jgi:hypothetical protein